MAASLKAAIQKPLSSDLPAAGGTLTGATDVSAGGLTLSVHALTPGTATVTNSAAVRRVWHRFDWTNAMVVALGAGTDLTVCTLPAKSIVHRCLVVIGTAATQVAALTVSVGRTGTAYIDWIVASNAKAAANTVYGDAFGEVGTGLYDTTEKMFKDDLPSWTGTTAVKAQFLIGAGTNADVLTSTGAIYIEVSILP